MNGAPPHFYRFGPFRLDVKQHLLFRHDVLVALPPKAFETLLVLVRNHGRLVGKGELLESVWPDTFVEEATLNQNVFTIRRALGADQEGADKYIQTISKRGYRFVEPVTALWEGDAKVQAGQSGASAQDVKGEEAGRPHEQIKSLAVMPMSDASEGRDIDDLCEGFTGSIADMLSLLPGLRVKACSTLVRYRRKGVDPQQAGRELGVDAVLVGKFLSFEERMILRVELIEVENGWHLWGKQYDEHLTNVCRLHEDIAGQVSQKLRLSQENVVWRRMAGSDPKSAGAYRLYLRGRSSLNKHTKLGCEQAIEAFTEAIWLAPDYTFAYTGLADAYVLYDFYGVEPPWQTIPKARDAAAKAVALDDGLVEAHGSLGSVKLVFDRDVAGAEKEFRRAIELNPQYARAHDGYSQCLLEMGRAEEAKAECEIALELAPFDPEINKHLAAHYLYGRQYDQAIEQLKKTLEMGPDFTGARLLLGIAYELKGAYLDAIAEFDRARRLEDVPVVSGFLGHAYAAAGRKAEALALVAGLIERAKQSYVPPHSIATVYIGLGDREEALAWLQRASVERSRWRGWLKLMPGLEQLRGDERFAELLERMR